MVPSLIRIGAAFIAVGLLTCCKGSGGADKASDAKGGGLFGRKKDKDTAAQLEQQRQQQMAANGLGAPGWQRDANSAINGARQKLPGFDPRTAPRRNPDIHVPIDRNRARSLTYSRVKVNGPYIALTVDDGPHPVHTPRLLDILKARNVKATFYVVGTNARRYPNILRRMVAEGHEIGNHTVNHVYVSKIAEAKAKQEVRDCEAAIVAATGVRPRTFRPPGGYINDRVKLWLKDDFDYSTIMWAVDPQDWKDRNSSIVTQRILANTNAGEIVLIHDIHASTIAAMPRTLDGLLGKGFRFATISQLIAMENSGFAATPGSEEPAEEAAAPAIEPTPLPSVDPSAGTAESSAP
jgi:peptidoglycan/xylan/chitin deacetylase (PgdA/CDA1 family)